MQLALCCQITMDGMLAGGQDTSPCIWSSATRAHPSSPSIWQPLSDGRRCQEKSGEAAGTLGFGKEFQRFVLKTQVATGNIVG
jgi:hypothetical protein